MNKAEWQKVEKLWFGFQSLVFRFQNGDDKLSLELHIDKRGSADYWIYINGFFEGKWSFADQQCPEQKYLRRIAKPVCSPKEEKFYKRLAKLRGEKYQRKFYSYYDHRWRSFKQFQRHFNEVAPDMRLVYPELEDESKSESHTP